MGRPIGDANTRPVWFHSCPAASWSSSWRLRWSLRALTGPFARYTVRRLRAVLGLDEGIADTWLPLKCSVHDQPAGDEVHGCGLSCRLTYPGAITSRCCSVTN